MRSPEFQALLASAPRWDGINKVKSYPLLRCRRDCIHFDEPAHEQGRLDDACRAGMDVGNPDELCRCKKGKR